MELILLRHTKVNVAAGMCYGQTDVGLADSFSNEVESIKKIMQHKKMDAVYSSPLKRCFLLANALQLKHTIQFDNRLKELNFGKWEGQFWHNFEKSEAAQHWFKDYVNHTCPEGESYRMLINRVAQFLSDLKKKHTNKTVLLLTHAGVIRAFLCVINGVEPKDSFHIKVEYGQVIKCIY